jgi:hypothetical protein
MFSFITDLFRVQPQTDDVRYTRSTYSGTGQNRTISYDPTLINGLKKDHSGLVNIYQRLWSEGYERQDFRQLAHLLTLFKSNFQAHLIKENVRFYVYLEQSLVDDVHTLQIVKDFRADMNEIASAVVHFCKRYTHEAFSEEMIRDFKRDYQQIGEALTRRVGLEEQELYTLYQPG